MESREQRLLALFIMHHRTKQELTINALAKKSGLMPTTIGSIEREKNSTTFKTVCLVLNGLSKTFSDLDKFIIESDFFRDAPCILNISKK